MARKVNFTGSGLQFSAELVRYDRNKVYGFTQIEVRDKDGNECRLGSISSDGLHILPSGSTGHTTLDGAGNYIKRDAAVAVDTEGNELEKIPSIFNRDVELELTDDINRFLELEVKSIYQLRVEEGMENVMAELDSGKLLRFDYNYRDAVTQDDAYILKADESLFMVIGEPLEFNFIGLQAKEEDLPEEEYDEDEDFLGHL